MDIIVFGELIDDRKPYHYSLSRYPLSALTHLWQCCARALMLAGQIDVTLVYSQCRTSLLEMVSHFCAEASRISTESH